ncbi:HNH endonuclease signature motif containing protein [Corynebacterium sp. NPDC060344]|uniref:HNH endonuclease signature motif containing protein n=1 Tax=Corynebacterium sp. NPDC060344 TaxID=3347101 RepID=UPI003659E433
MAFDHDAADEHDDPDHHHDQEIPARPRKRWVTERDEPVAAIGRVRNIADVDLSVAVTPDGDADVDSHIASVATRLGLTRHWAGRHCDVGMMFARMPKVLEFARSGALPHFRLAKIADAIIAVSDDHIAQVEERILAYLRPTKDLQALPGPKVFSRRLREIVEAVEPISTPPDEEEKKALESESVSILNDGWGDFGQMDVWMRKDRLAEFEATLRAIRDAKIKAGEDCTLADALMAMSRGDFAGAKVTMNVYADANATLDGDGGGDGSGELRLWLDGAGWLPKYLTRQWLERCEDVRLSADSQVDGYVPSDAQKARVRARDGGCRFPGCDVPAHRCQIDHVINYDPDASGAAFVAGDGSNQLGVTATWNLQCLCQHHHNLKTSRHWNAVMNDDGSVDWFDHTGSAFATSVPHGPIAHIKRQTFDQRATRLATTIHGDNLRRMRAEADAAAAMQRAEVDAALRKYTRDLAEYERAMAEYTAGPLNDPDPEVAEEARCMADAADDGWPAADDSVWDPGWESRSWGSPNEFGHSGTPGQTSRSWFGWTADEDPDADAFWRVSPPESAERRRPMHRASIDADPGSAPVPPVPPDPHTNLGSDSEVPF